MASWQPVRPETEAKSRAHSAPLAQVSSAVALLVVTAISTVVGLFFAIPALVLAIIAVILQGRSTPRSVSIARWGWIAYVVGAVLMLLAGVALVAIAGYAAGGNG